MTLKIRNLTLSLENEPLNAGSNEKETKTMIQLP